MRESVDCSAEEAAFYLAAAGGDVAEAIQSFIADAAWEAASFTPKAVDSPPG